MSQFTRAYLDGEDECLVIKRVDETGADVEGYPIISIALGDLVDMVNLLAQFRLLHFTDKNDGLDKQVAVLATKPESESDDGDAEEDVYVGGGGNGPYRARMKAIFKDYLRCVFLTSGGEGAEVFVAKDPNHRHGLTSQTVPGGTASYDGYSISGGVCTRVAHQSGKADQNEALLPIYQLGTGPDSEIWIDMPAGGTGATRNDSSDSGYDNSALVWMDSNRAGRAWCETD